MPTTSHTQEDRLEQLFAGAMALPPDARGAFLRKRCGPDTDLRVTLEALLVDAARAHDFGERILGPVVTRVTEVLLGASEGGAEGPADSLVGFEIAHFRILEWLGGGGMGRVYKARDLRLDRVVALKVLPPHLTTDDDANRRFAHEARAASALDHANICTVHETGQTETGLHFIAMAYCAGETLKQKIARGPLAIPAVLGYVAQVADALQRAHDAGIVHRDVKPANVIISDDGVVKLVDFGLAKIAGSDVTREGRMFGTVAYMSPEQVRGEAVDARADLWSVGAMLYEMLTGQRPFASERDETLIYAIRYDAPRPIRKIRPEIPAELAQVVHRSLEKDRARRYHRAADLLADVRRVQGGHPPHRVAPSRRALRYAGMGAVLSALLFVIWVRRPVDPGIDPQLPLTAQERARLAEAEPRINPEAFVLYLKSARTGDATERMQTLEQAIRKDSTFALAHAKVAVPYVTLLRDKAKAERAIATALALDPLLSDAYDALGLLRSWLDRDWPAAETAFRHAIKLNPHNSLAHHELGMMLMRVARCDEAVVEAERAVLQSPGVAQFQSGIGEVYKYCRRYDDALREFRRNLVLVRDSAGMLFDIAEVYFHQGRYAEAFAMYGQTSRPIPTWAYAASGREREARAQITIAEAEWARGRASVVSWGLARSFASLGEREKALDWLERAYDSGSGMVVYLRVHPQFDALRSEPRFQALLRKAHLAS